MKKNFIKLGITKSALFLITATMSAQKITIDERMYRLIDADSDGIITRSEYKASKLNRSLPEEQQKKNFKNIDINKDEGLTLEEFTINRRHQRNLAKAELEKAKKQEIAFKKLDANHNRRITLKEYASSKINESMSQNELEENYKKMDKDNDGNIVLREYKSGISIIESNRKKLIEKASNSDNIAGVQTEE